ncbi:putative protein TPRXL, partial [Ophiophagus hannah]
MGTKRKGAGGLPKTIHLLLSIPKRQRQARRAMEVGFIFSFQEGASLPPPPPPPIFPFSPLCGGGGGSFSSQAPMRQGGGGGLGKGASLRWALPTALLSVVLKSKRVVCCALRGAETPLGQLRCAVVASARRHPPSSSSSSSSFSSSSSSSPSSFSSASNSSSSSSSSPSFTPMPRKKGGQGAVPWTRQCFWLSTLGILPKASASPPPFDAARKMPSHWRWKGERWGARLDSSKELAVLSCLREGMHQGSWLPCGSRDWRSGETSGEKLAS